MNKNTHIYMYIHIDMYVNADKGRDGGGYCRDGGSRQGGGGGNGRGDGGCKFSRAYACMFACVKT